MLTTLLTIVSTLLTVSLILLAIKVIELQNKIRVIAHSQLETLTLIGSLFQLNAERENKNDSN